jgi:hypothetical protein
MKNKNTSGNRNLTLGDGIHIGSALVLIVAYYIIFNLVTGHYPRMSGRYSHYDGPGGWEGPLGFMLGWIGGYLVRLIFEKLLGHKL